MPRLNGEQQAILKGKNYAALATVNKDGSPQVTLAWVDTDGENILVNTAFGRTKERNTERDSRISIVVPDWKDPERRVNVQGTVVDRISGKRAADHINELSLRYDGQEYSKDRSRRVIFVIRPDRFLD